jgi:hypothetical protein
MRSSRLLAFLSLLALWLQLVAPVAMADAEPGVDPFSIICSHGSVDPSSGSQPAHKAGDHGCCVLCHAQLGVVGDTARPSFTIIDFPVASPLRWRLVADPPRPARSLSRHRPRGPPSLV